MLVNDIYCSDVVSVNAIYCSDDLVALIRLLLWLYFDYWLLFPFLFALILLELSNLCCLFMFFKNIKYYGYFLSFMIMLI